MQWRADEWGMARGGTTFWTEKEIVVQLPLEKNANVLLQMPASTSVSQRSSVCSLDQTRHHRGLTWHQLRSIPTPRRSFSHPPTPTPKCHPGPEGAESLQEWLVLQRGYIEFHKKPPSVFQNGDTVLHFQQFESLCHPTSHWNLLL